MEKKLPPSASTGKSQTPTNSAKFHAQYDWTTGVLDNGNEWRKFCVVPRLYPLRSLVCTLFNKGGSRGAFRLPGVGGDHFHCTVEPSPGHIRCRQIMTVTPKLDIDSYVWRSATLEARDRNLPSVEFVCCDCGGHLQNGKPARRKNPGKNRKENGKWPAA